MKESAMSPVLTPAAGSQPRPWALVARLKRALAGTVAALAIVAQAIAEAREMQRAAHKHYPQVGE
jgi:hypothetical protein